MIRAVLHRAEATDQGTFGTLVVPDRDNMTLRSIELPWRDNHAERSCIPSGIYRVAWTLSPKFGRKTYELQAVPGRSAIRIHSGNFAGDVDQGWQADFEGCIGLGGDVGRLENRNKALQRALEGSRAAIAIFEAAMNGESFELEIVGP